MSTATDRRNFLKGTAAALALAAAGGGIAYEAMQRNPALIRTFGPSHAALSGNPQIVDSLAPPIATYNAPNMAVVSGAFGFAGRAVPQEGGAYLNYSSASLPSPYTGRCIIGAYVEGAAYLPQSNPVAYLRGEPPYNTQPPFTTAFQNPGNQATVTIDVAHPYVLDGANAWYPVSFSGAFASTNTNVRIFLGGQTQWYWLQIGRVTLTLQ